MQSCPTAHIFLFVSVENTNISLYVCFLKLAAHCDVLIENYIPGQLEKMGLSYQQIKKHNPRLIYCSITGQFNHLCYYIKLGDVKNSERFKVLNMLNLLSVHIFLGQVMVKQGLTGREQGMMLLLQVWEG